MRVLLVHAHPVADSFSAALCAAIQEALGAAGHQVDLCDLYAERFDPVLSADARARYHDPRANLAGVEPYVERLRAAEALVLCFPVWDRERFAGRVRAVLPRVLSRGSSSRTLR